VRTCTDGARLFLSYGHIIGARGRRLRGTLFCSGISGVFKMLLEPFDLSRNYVPSRTYGRPHLIIFLREPTRLWMDFRSTIKCDH
jgi:hypothetical protein